MGKLVKCKLCGATIAKSARRCPHCGGRQHGLVKCETCGATIENSVNRCPHCGAPQHVADRIIMTLLVLFFLFIIVYMDKHG